MDEVICNKCGELPCAWFSVAEVMEEHIGNMSKGESQQNLNEKVNNARIRKALYRLYIYEVYGHLGRGVRVCIAKCVKEKIREAFKDPNNDYMGHMSE